MHNLPCVFFVPGRRRHQTTPACFSYTACVTASQNLFFLSVVRAKRGGWGVLARPSIEGVAEVTIAGCTSIHAVQFCSVWFV